MHSRTTENDHVKTNLSHKIHRIRNIGILKLDGFKDLISFEDYANCIKIKDYMVPFDDQCVCNFGLKCIFYFILFLCSILKILSM